MKLGLRLVLSLALFLVANFATAMGRDVYYKGHDGSTQHGVYFPAAQPRAAILYFHGFQSHTGWLQASGLADRLNESGITVFAYDRRGSGQSQSQRGHADNANQLLTDVNDALAAFEQELKKDDQSLAVLPLHAYANCFGMRVLIPYVSAMARQGHSVFRSIVAVSPSTDMRAQADFDLSDKMKMMLQPKDSYYASKLRDEWFVPGGPWLSFLNNDALAMREGTISFYLAARDLTRELDSAMRQLPVPMLFVVTDQDEIVDSAAVYNKTYRNYPGKKNFVTLRGPHYAEFTEEQDRLVTATVRWIYEN